MYYLILYSIGCMMYNVSCYGMKGVWYIVLIDIPNR